jgi:hypothetical protein
VSVTDTGASEMTTADEPTTTDTSSASYVGGCQ